MKKLSEFKNADGIVKASEVLSVILSILSDERNRNQSGETNAIKMFSAFFKHSPKEMMHLFAILSDENPESYQCDGSEALRNMLILADDPILLGLFISQRQKGDAKSSVSASVSTED